MKKILFFKLGAIGDTLMTTPLLRQVRKNFPDAQINYLIGGHSAGVLEGNKNLDNVTSFDESIFVKKKLLQWLKLIRKIKKEKYDIVFVLDKHWIFNLTVFLAGIPVRVGFDRLGKEGMFLNKKVYYDQTKHDISYYLDLAKALGLKIKYDDTQMDIFISKYDTDWVNVFWKKNKLGKNVIGIAPGGAINPGQTLFAKRWPTEKFAQLCQILSRKYQILLIGGKDDTEAAEFIAKQSKVINAIGKSNLKQSAALIKKCKIFICNDSGPMHLASAAGIAKIISLFGPTDPGVLAPIGKRHKYIWHAKSPSYDIYGKLKFNQENDISRISINEVLECIK